MQKQKTSCVFNTLLKIVKTWCKKIQIHTLEDFQSSYTYLLNLKRKNS